MSDELYFKLENFYRKSFLFVINDICSGKYKCERDWIKFSAKRVPHFMMITQSVERVY